MIRSLYPLADSKLVTVDIFIVVTALLEVFGELIGNRSLRYLLKLLPICGLLYVAMYATEKQNLHKGKYLIAYLVFCGIGDAFLLSSSESLFMTGSLSFLVGHLFSIYLMRATIGRQEWTKDESLNIKIAIGVVWALTLLNFVFLFDKFFNKTVCLLYGAILMTKLSCAILRYKGTSPHSFWTVLKGALLFAVSDNLLAFLKFNHISSNVGAAGVMITYYAAQYFVTYGILTSLTTRVSK